MSAEPARGRFLVRASWIAAALAVAFAARLDWTPPGGAPEAAAPEERAPAAVALAPRVERAHTMQPPRPAAPIRVALPHDSELDGHPHPITPEHVRIQRELQLIQQLNDALDLRDAAQLRSLIAEYAQHVPGDPNALAAGYARIADCLEHPGNDARELAREYYTRERASTLRRYVRRVCFDDKPVQSAEL